MTTSPDAPRPAGAPTDDELADQVRAVARTVDVRSLEGALEDEVVLAQTFPADIDTVWESVSRAARIGQWFPPVTGDLRDGGRFSVEGNASGTVLSCHAPHRYEVTWEFAGEVSWVTVSLAREGEDDPAAVSDAGSGGVVEEGTRLTLSHRLPRAPQWESFGPGAVGIGWDCALLGLRLHLASGGAGGQAGQEWLVSPEGIGFVEASGRAWGYAHAASGLDEQVARAAADRTVAAYTGRPVA